jgi:tetratricopeptide (TPR) repeat protein
MLALIDAKGALDAFRRVTECEPDAFESWIEVARLEKRAGTLARAAAAAEMALRISEVDDRPKSLALDELGDVRWAQGDLNGALGAYEQGLAIAERLAGQDAANTEWQRDLSVSHDRIGDVRQAQGDLNGALGAHEQGLAIAERLAGQDAANTEWQRDLSVSHERIGDVRQAQGDLKGALGAYEQGLAIRERLAAQDATNATWRDDLAYSKKRIEESRKLAGKKSKRKRRL